MCEQVQPLFMLNTCVYELIMRPNQSHSRRTLKRLRLHSPCSTSYGLAEKFIPYCDSVLSSLWLFSFPISNYYFNVNRFHSNNQFNLVTVLLFNIIFYIYIIIIRPLYIYLLILGNIGEMQGFYGDFITTLHYLE